MIAGAVGNAIGKVPTIYELSFASLTITFNTSSSRSPNRVSVIPILIGMAILYLVCEAKCNPEGIVNSLDYFATEHE